VGGIKGEVIRDEALSLVGRSTEGNGKRREGETESDAEGGRSPGGRVRSSTAKKRGKLDQKFSDWGAG